MSDLVTRRGFVTLVAGAVGAMVQDSVPAGKVYDPRRAGRSMPPITAADNDPGIQAVEKQLRCSCGCGLDIYTCRTTDFNCTYSPALHKHVLQLASEGKSGEEIIADFVAQYGELALMAPPKRGFNLAGYFVPSLVIVVAGAFLVRALRRWTRQSAPLVVDEPAASAPAGTSAADLERLRRELDRLPG
jgi:cytochrome c-type biogenesis protein CcmH/NrfF